MNIYSLDVKVGATAYIKADTPEQALELAKQHMTYTGIQFSDRHQNLDEAGDPVICMDGRPYPALAENEEVIALSPVMTIHGPWDDVVPELAEESINA